MTFQKFLQYLLLGLFTYLFARIAWPFLPSICFAAVFAVILYPLQVKLSKRISRSWSAGILLVLSSLLILGPLLFLLFLLAKEALTFSSDLQESGLWEFLKDHKTLEIWGYTISLDSVIAQASETLKSISGRIYELAKSLGGSLASFSFSFFSFLFLLFYMLRDGAQWLPRIHELLPFKDKEEGVLFQNLSQLAKNMLLGTVLASVASGVLAYIGFTLFGAPAALILAVMTMVLSLIPTIGSLFVYLLAILLVGISSGAPMALGLLIYFIILECIGVQNLLKPRWIEDRMSFHPIFIFFSLVGGVEAFGSMGLLYGPLIAMIFFSFLDFLFTKNKTIKSNLTKLNKTA